MQQKYWARPIFLRTGLPAVTAVAALLAATGCPERPTTIDPPPARPFAGVVLSVAVADPRDRDLVHQLARSWALRTGAEVRVLDTPYDGQADVGFIPPADLPQWAAAGRLAEVPAARRSPTDPYLWDDLLPAYRDRLTTWAERYYALPVVGEGMVLVYRQDAFDGKDGRPATPPATWDELAAAAARLGPGSLPPLPDTAEGLLAQFFAAAACYDRVAAGRNAGANVLKEREAFFTFQFDMTTGDPRLDAPAFVHVADLFRQMQKFRGNAGDRAAAFRTGTARVGVLTLAELGRVGPAATEGLGIAPLPGAGFTFNAKGQRQPVERGGVNRVPYLGWSGRVGVVSATCPHPEAAWDFLADAGMPERAALDLLADPRWGAGPYRTNQLDSHARSRWYAYGLSATETERLTSALRENLGLGILNYRIPVRTANHAELDAAVHRHLRQMLETGQDPAAAMAAANAEWKTIIERTPRAEWLARARKSLGF